MEYDVYHDESKEDGYWHGILLIPRSTRSLLLTYLQDTRSNTHFAKPITFKGLKRPYGPRYRSVRSWVSLASAALVQNSKGKAFHFYNGDDQGGAGTAELRDIVGARFILFRVRDDHHRMTGYLDYGQKVETTFRMGFKGGLHLFAKASSQDIEVCTFHFDGHEHYGRNVEIDRIVGRLGELRPGVTIAPNFSLHDETGNHTRPNSQHYDDCQLLQLADLLVSGFRCVSGDNINQAQRVATQPLRVLASKWDGGYARMKRSRWFGGFCISQCYLQNDEWVFEDIQTQSGQGELFNGG